jgi:ABC-type phosphonate transport system ATPase subunit
MYPKRLHFMRRSRRELIPANEIVLVGHGTGKSSAVEFLMTYLKMHHSEIGQRVRGVETADLFALTEPEIEAIAKKHMITVV